MPNKGFIKISKDFLQSSQFRDLSNSSKVLLFCLLELSNRFRSFTFFQYNTEIKKRTDLSRVSLWRCSKELLELDIKFSSTNNQYNFDLTKFYEKYPEMT